MGISFSPLFSLFSPLEAPSPEEPWPGQSACAGWWSAVFMYRRGRSRTDMALSSLCWWSCFGADGILCQPQQHLGPIVRPPRPLCSKESGNGGFAVGSWPFRWALSGCCSLGLCPHGEAALLPSARPFGHTAALGCPAPHPAVGILPLLPLLLCPILQTHCAPSQSTWNKAAVLVFSQFPLFSCFFLWLFHCRTGQEATGTGGSAGGRFPQHKELEEWDKESGGG